MLTTKVASAAALLVVLGGAAACGSSDSSSSASGGPTDADKTTFCSSLQGLDDNTTPKEAAAALAKVGTPSDIPADARAGYEIVIQKLSTLADDASSADLAAMAKGLSGTEQQDFIAFGKYLTTECTGDLPSAPAS